MASPAFCLYLWRSVDSPGTLYLAKNLDSAEAVYAELSKEGYIVRAVHMATDSEYVMRDGVLLPAQALSPR